MKNEIEQIIVNHINRKISLGEATSQILRLVNVSGMVCGTCTDFKIVGKVFVCKKCGKEQKNISA